MIIIIEQKNDKEQDIYVDSKHLAMRLLMAKENQL